jgi:hypothetical protein
VTFLHDTSASAQQLLFNWLLELPDAQAAPASLESRAAHCDAANSTFWGDGSSTAAGTSATAVAAAAAAAAAAHNSALQSVPNPGQDAAAAVAAGPEELSLTASQDRVRLVLEAVSGLLPYKPSLIIKQLPDADSAAFSSRVQSNVPAAVALAAAASRRTCTNACVAAAGWVDGRAAVCVTTKVLGKDMCSAAFVVVTAAMQGLGLSNRQCAAAFEVVVNHLQAAEAATAVAAPAEGHVLCSEGQQQQQQQKLDKLLAESEVLAKADVWPMRHDDADVVAATAVAVAAA